MKDKIEEAAKQADKLKRKLYNTKLIPTENAGDCFRTDEVMRYINGVEAIFEALSQQEPVKGVEELKTKWIKELEMWKRTYGENALFHTDAQKKNAISYASCITSFLSDVEKLLPHLTPNNQQSEAVGFLEFVDLQGYYKANIRQMDGLIREVYMKDGNMADEFTAEQLFTEYQKQKGINQPK